MDLIAVVLLFAQAAALPPLPQVSIRDDGIWIEQSERTALRVGEKSLCNAIDRLEWIDPSRLAVECHINPSLSEYFEIDMAAGRAAKDLLGYWFTRSPDRAKVAHVGWIPHFAPPSAKSNELQIDGKTVYPLESRANGNAGIHEFIYGLGWSADSTLVAFVERVYDWEPESPDSNAGKESNQKYFLVVAGPGQRPLSTEVAPFIGESHITWTAPKILTYSAASQSRAFKIDKGQLVPTKPAR